MLKSYDPLPPALETGVLALFGGDPASRGVVLDLSVIDEPGYAAVVRKPTGYIVWRVTASAGEAAYAIEEFWNGMRALLAPA